MTGDCCVFDFFRLSEWKTFDTFQNENTVIEGNSTNTRLDHCLLHGYILLSLSFLLTHHKPQSSNSKQLLPLIPISIRLHHSFMGHPLSKSLCQNSASKIPRSHDQSNQLKQNEPQNSKYPDFCYGRGFSRDPEELTGVMCFLSTSFETESHWHTHLLFSQAGKGQSFSRPRKWNFTYVGIIYFTTGIRGPWI